MIHDTIFENINKVIDYLNEQGWTLSITNIRNDLFEVIDYGNGRLVYYPLPFGTPFFRGQNQFYEPCIASLYRLQADILSEFVEKLRIEEFRIVTAKHPIIAEQLNNGINYDYIALAQHYGFKTEMLDATNSLPVAAFFAVTRQINGKFYPIEKSENPGVLYFISPETAFVPKLTDNQLKTHPVGWQVFKRPGKQRAFGINLTDGKDFNKMPGVFAFRFMHDKSISEQIWKLFHKGDDLFPKDVFADKAARINESFVFSKQAFDLVYEKSNKEMTKETILNELGNRNIKIQKNSIWDYSDSDIAELKELSTSGKLTEKLYATTRLCYIPDEKNKHSD